MGEIAIFYPFEITSNLCLNISRFPPYACVGYWDSNHIWQPREPPHRDFVPRSFMFILYNVAFSQHFSAPRRRLWLGVCGCVLFYKLLHLGCSLCALSLRQSCQQQLRSCSNSHMACTWHTISRTTYSLRLLPWTLH